MIDGLRVLAVITARGGSKGVVGKNLRELGGRPLIVWTVEAAHESQYLDRTILSSDDDAIIECARSIGCDVPFVRPTHLATDTASSMDVLRHALKQEGAGYDLLVLLQPTSPFRTAGDIDSAIEQMLQEGARTCIGVEAVTKSPYWMFVKTEEGKLAPLMKGDSQIKASRRQDLPTTYAVNGAVYVAYVGDILAGGELSDDDTIGYVMPEERSLDIDTEHDLKVAEAML